MIISVKDPQRTLISLLKARQVVSLSFYVSLILHSFKECSSQLIKLLWKLTFTSNSLQSINSLVSGTRLTKQVDQNQATTCLFCWKSSKDSWHRHTFSFHFIIAVITTYDGAVSLAIALGTSIFTKRCLLFCINTLTSFIITFLQIPHIPQLHPSNNQHICSTSTPVWHHLAQKQQHDRT